MSRLPTLPLLARRSNPSIIPIAPTRSGNNKPKSLQKTKRTFKPNLTRVDWPVTLLGGPVPLGEEAVLPKLRGVKMQMRAVRDVEKAGGIEGLLLSRRSKDLTPYGAYLRSQVFTNLHRIKEELDAEKGLRRGLPIERGAESVGVDARAEVPLLEGR
ncbi:hypothetical protein I317_03480 [Kwoniella heveanensis CBS 569]|uniref:Uncharacterized protein n=1 Tax=Kwoniella heveanensis BCC8398 TaxID=1296120 RepID=A0A1B9H3L9_9TREE|nr:hypothetical protein I316_00083 [Kwoniella heveanensis BCC8398]OCF42749.1 hypothetical protein I317_03480 [Kwoniella heveanensis CBS 569]